MLPTGLCLVCVMCPCVCLMTRLESKLYILEIIEEMVDVAQHCPLLALHGPLLALHQHLQHGGEEALKQELQHHGDDQHHVDQHGPLLSSHGPLPALHRHLQHGEEEALEEELQHQVDQHGPLLSLHGPLLALHQHLQHDGEEALEEEPGTAVSKQVLHHLALHVDQAVLHHLEQPGPGGVVCVSDDPVEGFPDGEELHHQGEVLHHVGHHELLLAQQQHHLLPTHADQGVLHQVGHYGHHERNISENKTENRETMCEKCLCSCEEMLPTDSDEGLCKGEEPSPHLIKCTQLSPATAQEKIIPTAPALATILPPYLPAQKIIHPSNIPNIQYP